jgi:hypothetical protein
MGTPIRFMKKDKAIDDIKFQLERDCSSWCMDDEKDRERMAEWIYNHFRL